MRALLLLLLVASVGRAAESVSVAAASNLVHALDALNAAFKQKAPDVGLTATTGASGSLFAQIRNGAPFDIFLSADREYPEKLAAAGLGDPATLRVFATGRLVLWTTRSDLAVSDPAVAVRSATVRRIAVAQPRTAPYGQAAEKALAQLGVLDQVRSRIVWGENISQTARGIL